MIFTVNIDNNEIEMSNAFSWMFKYKSQFHEDPAAFLVPAFAKTAEDPTGMAALAEIGFTRLSNMAWAMAKAANKNVPDPVTWVNGFETFNVLDFAGDLIEKAVSGMTVTNEDKAGTSKNPEAVAETANR